MRLDGREFNELRSVSLHTSYLKHPEGSVLISVGDTKVICTASIDDRVPPFMRGQGKGWIQLNILCCLELRHKEIYVNHQKVKSQDEQWKFSV